MKNKACIVIDSCSDCYNLVRSHCSAIRNDSLDNWFCAGNDNNGSAVLIAEGLSIDDEQNVEIPGWCPILQIDKIEINKPKKFKIQ